MSVSDDGHRQPVDWRLFVVMYASAATKRGNIGYWDIRAPFQSIKRESVSGCKVNGTRRRVHTAGEPAW